MTVLLECIQEERDNRHEQYQQQLQLGHDIYESVFQTEFMLYALCFWHPLSMVKQKKRID